MNFGTSPVFDTDTEMYRELMFPRDRLSILHRRIKQTFPERKRKKQLKRLLGEICETDSRSPNSFRPHNLVPTVREKFEI